MKAQEKIKELNIRRAIECAYEREFDYIEAAVEFLRKEAPWFEEGENQDFAAIMLATEDRDGLRFSSAEANGEHSGQLDPLFDRWMNL